MIELASKVYPIGRKLFEGEIAKYVVLKNKNNKIWKFTTLNICENRVR
jgi:hypothetical protein